MSAVVALSFQNLQIWRRFIWCSVLIYSLSLGVPGAIASVFMILHGSRSHNRCSSQFRSRRAMGIVGWHPRRRAYCERFIVPTLGIPWSRAPTLHWHHGTRWVWRSGPSHQFTHQGHLRRHLSHQPLPNAAKLEPLLGHAGSSQAYRYLQQCSRLLCRPLRAPQAPGKSKCLKSSIRQMMMMKLDLWIKHRSTKRMQTTVQTTIPELVGFHLRMRSCRPNSWQRWILSTSQVGHHTLTCQFGALINCAFRSGSKSEGFGVSQNTAAHF